MIDDDMFRVLQIKCRLHKSLMREGDVRVSIKRPSKEGEMTRRLVLFPDKCKAILKRILLVGF
jgi:hypothetical protein